MPPHHWKASGSVRESVATELKRPLLRADMGCARPATHDPDSEINLDLLHKMW